MSNRHQRFSRNFNCEWFASRRDRCNMFGSSPGTDSKNANEAWCVCCGGTIRNSLRTYLEICIRNSGEFDLCFKFKINKISSSSYTYDQPLFR